MNSRVLQLAIQALESQRAEIELEIQALQIMIKDGTTPQTVATRGKRTGRTPAQRKAQSERMRQYWQRKRASNKRKSGPQSAAARKAISNRMKAYWAKRKAEAAKKAKKTA